MRGPIHAPGPHGKGPSLIFGEGRLTCGDGRLDLSQRIFVHRLCQDRDGRIEWIDVVDQIDIEWYFKSVQLT